MLDGTANKKYTRTNTRDKPQGRGMQWTQALVHPASPLLLILSLASQTPLPAFTRSNLHIAQSLRRGQRGQQWESNHATVSQVTLKDPPPPRASVPVC